MKLFIVPKTNIKVLFRTRGEHRPPHVHVQNREVPWEAKIRFSFVEDTDLEVLQIDPETNEPNASTIREVLLELHNQLALVRRKWWETFGTVCLEGKWVRQLSFVPGQPQFEVLKGYHAGAIRMKGVTFVPASGDVPDSLLISLRDGSSFKAPVGTGRDLSDKH